MIERYLQSVGTFLIGLALIIAVFVGSNAIQTRFAARTLVVTGKATQKLASNQSVVSGSWREKGKTAAEAREATQKKAGEGIAAVKALGIDEAKLKTVEASVYPEYDYTNFTGREAKILDYQGTTTLEVTLTDPTKAEAVLAALTKSGTTTTSGPSFGLSTEASDAIQKELKVAAVADAHNQAQALAKQAGGRLGAVITVAGGDLSSGSNPYPMATRAASDLAVASPEKSDLQTGENEIAVTVQVTYRLR